MGTVSFDGSLRTWDLKTMKLDQIFTDRSVKGDRDRILQCLAWYPHKTTEEMNASLTIGATEDDPDLQARGKIACIGTSGGFVKLVDLNKNKVLWRQEYNGSCVYGLDWAANGQLAVGPTTPEV